MIKSVPTPASNTKQNSNSKYGRFFSSSSPFASSSSNDSTTLKGRQEKLEKRKNRDPVLFCPGEFKVDIRKDPATEKIIVSVLEHTINGKLISAIDSEGNITDNSEDFRKNFYSK